MNIYQLCADDIDVSGDLYVKAKTKEDALKYFMHYIEEQTRKYTQITEMTEHEFWYEDDGEGPIEGYLEEEGVVEEEH